MKIEWNPKVVYRRLTSKQRYGFLAWAVENFDFVSRRQMFRYRVWEKKLTTASNHSNVDGVKRLLDLNNQPRVSSIDRPVFQFYTC